MTAEEYMLVCKGKDWKFNNIVGKDAFMNVSFIHPLKQCATKAIVDVARKDNTVKKVIIFGSSIRDDCDVTSDLDICIEWNQECYDENGVLKPFTSNMRRTISMVTKGHADVVNYEYAEGTVVADAVREGVVVYEHNV